MLLLQLCPGKKIHTNFAGRAVKGAVAIKRDYSTKCSEINKKENIKFKPRGLAVKQQKSYSS